MLRKILLIINTIALAASLASAADTPASRGDLSAAEIVNKNIAARGGLQAWRAVKTMSMEGRLAAGGNQRTPLPAPVPGKNERKLQVPSRPKEEVQLPFVMKMERPRKMRFELEFKGQTAVQVFDGANGWKLRPFLNRLEVEPFTPEELKAATLQPDIDGPLVDYMAKGTQIELDGVEKVDDRDAYKIKLTEKNGRTLHVWIDARTFLEAKIEGLPRRMDGKEHPVEIYFRDYRTVSGIQIPFVLETRLLPVDTNSKVKELPMPPEQITLEKVVINPQFDSSLFSKPLVETASNRQ